MQYDLQMFPVTFDLPLADLAVEMIVQGTLAE